MTGKAMQRSPTMDTVLDVLANKYRRRVLVTLLEHNPQDDDDPKIPADIDLGDEELEALRTHMTHTHLPKLEDMGFIEWDRDVNTVRKGSQFDEVQPLLELIENHTDELPDDCL
ncbi:DUF7344 domain-containing protein [Halomicrococcus sp. NG-SE-24]|uniref:DUF7344 domain-containing protein n=1 Tax=Halomicrococcus sp. NG-SE-24 TaxID=3436928 RepID=UPI003D977C71